MVEQRDKVENRPSSDSPQQTYNTVELLRTYATGSTNCIADCLPAFTVEDRSLNQTRGAETAHVLAPPVHPHDKPGEAARTQRFERQVEKSPFSMGETTERSQLIKSIESNASLSDSQRRAMIGDIKALEKRAVRDHISREEILGTYRNVSRLMEAKDQHIIGYSNRVLLSQEVLKQAAHPMSIDQGQHSTCNVATVEARIYSRCPSKAAELVADVALTGKYKTSDGQVSIDKNSLIPDPESRNFPVRDGDRSYASQVFQLTAANIYWQQRTRDLSGNLIPKGELRYVQIPPLKSLPGDTGERIRDSKGQTLSVTEQNGSKSKILEPYLGLSNLVQISNEIGKKEETGFIIQNKDNGSERNVAEFATKAEFGRMLSGSKEKYPIIMMVHTYHEPFWKDSGHGARQGSGGDNGGWHVVNITGFDEKRGEVQISNQWGSKSDKKVSLDALYKASFGPP